MFQLAAKDIYVHKHKHMIKTKLSFVNIIRSLLYTSQPLYYYGCHSCNTCLSLAGPCLRGNCVSAGRPFLAINATDDL